MGMYTNIPRDRELIPGSIGDTGNKPDEQALNSEIRTIESSTRQLNKPQGKIQRRICSFYAKINKSAYDVCESDRLV